MSGKSAGQTLFEKADKKANSSTGWFSSSSTKFEDAGDLYQQAANAFKFDKAFKEAGDAFAREADCREKCQEVNDAANAWWNAAKAYKQGHPDLAIEALKHTIGHLVVTGRFRQAADREKEIAQIYWKEKSDIRLACESFERAGDWYSQEDAHATANSCLKDAADLHAQLEDYDKAIKLYEIVADHSLSSPLTKYGVKEYWLKASLCALAMETDPPITAQRNMETYKSKDTAFSSTREGKFINALIEAVRDGDPDAFTALVVGFDEVTKLDEWKTSILLKIKRSMAEEPGLK